MMLKQLLSDGIRSSGWLLLAPLLAACAPRDLPRMYFNLHLRRYARRLVPFLDPFVTIDIASKYACCRSGQSFDARAYWEVKAYLTKERSRDVLEFRTEADAAAEGLLLTLREGQEVTDHFQGVTVWWLLVPSCGGHQDTCLRLMFPQRHRRLILDEYLPHARRSGRNHVLVTIDILDKTRARSYSTTDDLKSNGAFEQVKAYLSSACSTDVLDLCAEAAIRGDSFLLSLREGQEVADLFRGVTLWWLAVPRKDPGDEQDCLRLRLMFPQRHRRLVLDEYLPHVRRQGRRIMLDTRRQRLYTNKNNKRCYG